MRKQGVIYLIACLMLISSIYAAIDTTYIIAVEQESQKTRDYVKTELDTRDKWVKASFEQEKAKWMLELNNMLWFDRVLTFIIIGCAMLFGYGMSLLLNARNNRRLEALREQYKQAPTPDTLAGVK